MDWGYLAMFGIVAVGVFTLSYAFVRRRRYCSALESLGFAPYSGDRIALEPALESLHATKRFRRSSFRFRSLRRLEAGEQSIYHGLSVYGRGKSRSSSFVFVIPRNSEQPESPVTVFPNPTGMRGYDKLISVARVALQGHSLRIPDWLASSGIAGAVSEVGRDLADLLGPLDLQRLADAGKRGFNSILISREVVILMVAEYEFHSAEQVAHAREWLS